MKKNIVMIVKTAHAVTMGDGKKLGSKDKARGKIVIKNLTLAYSNQKQTTKSLTSRLSFENLVDIFFTTVRCL
jgi:hypothetical protein